MKKKKKKRKKWKKGRFDNILSILSVSAKQIRNQNKNAKILEMIIIEALELFTKIKFKMSLLKVPFLRLKLNSRLDVKTILLVTTVPKNLLI